MIKISKAWKEIKNGYVYAKVRIGMDAVTCKNWENYCNLPENFGFTNYLDKQYVDMTSGETELWFSVEEKYEEYLCVDRCDAFVVVLLHYAMCSGSDISCEAPISEPLLYHIQEEMIPHLCRGRFIPIKVEAETIAPAEPNQNCGATGMSCGIDSFFSLYLHSKKEIPSGYKIKYLTFFNVGAINSIFRDDIELDRRNELMLEMSRKKAAQAQEVADECDMELIFVNSNISDFYRGMLVNSAHYRNCGTAMILQGLWNKYYYSSAGFKVDEFKIDLCDDPAYHEVLLLSWLTNGTIQFYSAGHGYPRIEKTRMLAEYPIAQKFLTVCDRDENCGKCNKCKRTIASLMALGKLEEFSQRFDLKYVEKNKNTYKRYIFLKRKKQYYDQIYMEAEKNRLYSMKDKLIFYVESLIYEIAKDNMLLKKMHIKRHRNQIGTMK